jgi:Protein of unknown function (DUF2934)
LVRTLHSGNLHDHELGVLQIAKATSPRTSRNPDYPQCADGIAIAEKYFMNTASSDPIHPNPTPITREEIEACAHQLFLERGGEHGNDLEDWFRAEALLQERMASETAALPARSAGAPVPPSSAVRPPPLRVAHIKSPLASRDAVRRQKVPPAARQIASSHVEH